MERRIRSRVFEIIAHHEAGHAVIGLIHGEKLRFATIKPRGNYAGQVSFYAPKFCPSDKPKVIRFLVERHLLSALAGPFAQKRFAPRSSWRSGNSDFDIVRSVIRRIYGDDTKTAKGYQHWLERRAARQVDEHWRIIEAVAEALLEHETLTEDAILKL